MSKVLNQIFEDYNRSRVQFTQNIYDYCMKSYNIELLINTDIIIFLRPLILDKVPIVQQNATLILAKLASHSEDAALTIIQNDTLPHLIFCLKHENKNYRKNSAYTIKCLAKHNAKLANIVTEDNNCIDYLIDCLDEYDLKLKESCISSLCAIVKNDLELSKSIVNKGTIPLLILNLQEKEPHLIKCCIHLLAELSKQCSDIAKTIVDSNAVPLLIKYLDSNDVNIKRHTCNCLAQIAKHEEELTEQLIENDIFPKMLYLLKDNDDIVKKNCANCIKEMSKHNEDICKIIVKAGALNFLCDYIEQNTDAIKLPAILSIGFIASFSETLSLNIILTNAISILKKCLVEESEDFVKSACVWALGNIGKHSSEHTKKICDENILIIFVKLYNSNDSSDDLKKKIKISLKNIIQMVTNLEALEPIFIKCPTKLAKYSIIQFSKILPNKPTYKKSFIKSGCLQKLQEIKHSEEGKNVEIEINLINKIFPEDIVNFYTPGYSETLIKRIDEAEEK